MQKPRPAELVLGSVQLGIPYGAANRTGQPERAAALSLVQRAADCGIAKFDTARAYGDSEDRLGEALCKRRGIRTITKLSPLSNLSSNARRNEVQDAVDESINQSLTALRRDHLDCLLLHRASHRTDFDGAIWERLIELLEDGTILRLGVSVQSPEEAIAALECPDVQHLQLSFNLLDWRWRETGVIAKLRMRPHLTVHARSIFLQGILASEDSSTWPQIVDVNAENILRLLADLAQEFDRESVADLCLGYARGQDWIDGVVVGMETEQQLDNNLRLSAYRPLPAAHCEELERRVPKVPAMLLNPALWPKVS